MSCELMAGSAFVRLAGAALNGPRRQLLDARHRILMAMIVFFNNLTRLRLAMPKYLAIRGVTLGT